MKLDQTIIHLDLYDGKLVKQSHYSSIPHSFYMVYNT